MDFIDKINTLAKKNREFLFIIDFEIEKPLIFEIEKIPSNFYFSIGKIKKLPKIKKTTNTVSLNIKKVITYNEFLNSFNRLREEELKGNSYLTNLTFKTEIEINLSLEEIFLRSKSKYKLLIEDNFVVFSPETFIKIEDGYIYSFPMKGTIDASIPNAKEILLNDPKEEAEHLTIVDLIRNDLNSVASDIRVIDYRYVDVIKTNKKTILQTSSKIVGKMPEKYNEILGEIILKLLPAGSISGAPKKKTVEIIKDIETEKRGYYTGIFGHFDGKNLDSCVMIRFIEKNNDRLYYRSGGGITIYSDPEKEYKELMDKIYVPIY